MKGTAWGALALLSVALLSSPALADESSDRDAAVKAATSEAEHWLQAMDEHRYADAWHESAAVVREGHSEQEWVRRFATREAFGRTVMREFKRASFSTQVRGSPEGEYVTALFLTQFSNTPLAIETVLLSHESGEWRIGGYDVEPASQGEAAPSGPQDPSVQPKTKD
jgi:hypothetical protein